MPKQSLEMKCAELKNAFHQGLLSSEKEFEVEFRDTNVKWAVVNSMVNGSKLNGLLLEILINSIENELIKISCDNITAQKKKCICTYENILVHFQKSVVDEKISSTNGTKTYGNALTIMESRAKKP